MVRLDLAFLLCCCKAILGPLQGSKDGEETFYQILGIEKDASPEDIKRAYKRRSLQIHPDKLAQTGKVVTDEDRARFTRMKEAYEVCIPLEIHIYVSQKKTKERESSNLVIPRPTTDSFLQIFIYSCICRSCQIHINEKHMMLWGNGV